MPPKKIQRQNAGYGQSLMAPTMKMKAPERKDISIQNSAPGLVTVTGGLFSAGQLANGCAQGTSASQRVGRRVLLKSISIRFTWSILPLPTTTQNVPLRLLCVYDKQTNGLAPVSGAVLQVANFIGQKNLSNSERFIVLCDQVFDPPSPNTYAQGQVYRKLNLETVYSGIGDTIADIATGSIYFAWANPIASTVVQIQYDSRVRYSDC